jgi:hypothetical protein
MRIQLAGFFLMELTGLLFYCDFGAHADLGEPITGASYRKRPHGPFADEQLVAERNLLAFGAIEMETVGPQMHRQVRVVALRDADMSWFSTKQIALVDEVVERHSDDDALTLRTRSQAFPGYEVAFNGEEIPYHTVCISREGPTQEDIDRGLELIREGALP